MKQAIIDVGSNTIRMSVYEILDGDFRLLFSEKETAGLAGYVTSDNQMTVQGLEKTCSTLRHFSDILQNLDIRNLHVFATASLRNVSNTDECIKYIKEQTALTVEVLSGKQEAEYGCAGALRNINETPQLIFDVGGGSTEIVQLKNGKPKTADSLPIGSLVLFRKNVSRLFPKKDELDKMRKQAENMINDVPEAGIICGVGGTARALLKIINACSGEQSNQIKPKDFSGIYKILSKCNLQTRELILKNCPDRLHTIIPGMIIIRRLVKLSKCKKIIVSQYGVREGYLCRRSI